MSKTTLSRPMFGQVCSFLLPMLVPLWLASCGTSNVVTVPEDVPDQSGVDSSALDQESDLGPNPDGLVGKDESTPDGSNDLGQEIQNELFPEDLNHPCLPDQCLIEGYCYKNKEVNPDNPCQACLAAVDGTDWSAWDAETCDDGLACTLNDHCDSGQCVGAARLCGDSNPCTDSSCDPATGECLTTNNQAPCNDGDPCTMGDTCSAGNCLGGSGVLECTTDNECATASCQQGVGCVLELKQSGLCSDGDACTLGDHCVAGVCTPDSVVECNDHSLCTMDTCTDEGVCQFISVADLCVDSNLCTDDSCDPDLGCVYAFNVLPCDDSNKCTFDDVCTEGACKGAPVIYDDLELCTDDSCDPLFGVLNLPNSLPCNDLDPCTVGDTCTLGHCAAGTAELDCDDHKECTNDACTPGVGCEYENNTNLCNDNSVCTLNDVCTDGSCVGTELSCDDGNDCTDDTCDAQAGCISTLILSNACRPNIVVTYPPRAATILGTGAPLVVVTGHVTSGAGPITAFMINGEEVVVNPTDGAFAYPYAGITGHNTLVFSAEDSFGSVRDRVQAYHWSSEFRNPIPAEPGTGMVDPGLGIWLAQQTLDDNSHTLPPNDLATVFEMVLQGLDLNSMIPNPVITGQAIWGIGVYAINIQNLKRGAVQANLTAINGGIKVVATMPNITADILAKKTGCGGGFLEPCLGGDMTGNMSMSSIVLSANLYLSVNPDHTLKVVVADVVVTINGLDVNLDGVLGFLVNWIIDIFVPSLKGTIEAEFQKALVDTLGPMLADALSALAFNLDIPIPRLDGAIDPNTGLPKSIVLRLESDFSYTEFTANTGGTLGLRARSFSTERGVPVGDPFDSNLGTPGRIGCGLGPQTMVVPKVAPMEVVFPDDTLNQILHAAWWGGLLDFPVGPELLGGVDLSQFGVTDLELYVRALLPPLASDCGVDGELRLRAGDLQITASLSLFGQPMDVVMYGSFDAVVEITTANNSIGIIIHAIENFQLEVNILQDSLIASEPVMRDLVLSNLVPSLEGMLGGGEPLASIPLPEIDLSSAVGLPAGSVVIHIGILENPAWETRQGGNTIVYGQLQ